MLFFSGEERRRTERQWTAIPVVIRHGEARIDGVSINVSDGGIYLFAAASLRVGSEVQVQFRLPQSQETVSTLATVRRRALYLYGLEFSRVGKISVRELAVGAHP